MIADARFENLFGLPVIHFLLGGAPRAPRRLGSQGGFDPSPSNFSCSIEAMGRSELKLYIYQFTSILHH